MNKKIIIGVIVALVIVIGAIVLMTGPEEIIEQPQLTLEDSSIIAENWIVNNSPTYMFDGSNLALESAEETIAGQTYTFVFSFESAAAGYGDRSDQMVAQVITPHLMEVVVENGEVIKAVTDGVYDEIAGQEVTVEDPSRGMIYLYFVQVIDGQESVLPVERSVPLSERVEEAAIYDLLEGPSLDEENEGFSTAINPGTELNDFVLANGTALVDFNEVLEQGVAGSAWVMAIREQIEKTLLQFETIDEVIISINGRTEDILQP